MFGSSRTGAGCRRAACIGLSLALLAGCGGDGDGVAPDRTIRIDGLTSDWQNAPGVQRLTEDPAGDGRDQMAKAAHISAEADLRSVSVAHDAERLYFLLELGATRTVAAQLEYAVYLDADGKPETGYVVGDNAIGADFVIINGSLLRHDSTDRTEWKWITLDFKVEELETGAAEHALELSVDRRAIQMPGGPTASIGLLFSTIEQHDTTQWQDNITDFSPEKDGRPGRIDYRLRPLGPPAARVPPPRPAVAGVKSYLLYYGVWDRSIIEKVYRYDLVILDPHRGPRPSQIAPAVRRIRAGVNGIPGDADDVLVLGYISLGEDVRTFDNAPALPGDGRGPARWDRASNELVYQNLGIASYYLDEKDKDEMGGPDGLPDRHGTWGACYVNPGDPAWQQFLLGLDGRSSTPYSVQLLLDVLGYQGLFLDTPEVADPWHGYGYTAPGMYQAIGALRENFPGSLLLLNRGVFFFVPQFPVQYQWNPRRFIDIGLFESHLLDSDYGDADSPDYNLSPYFQGNTVFYDQKIQAELGRTDDAFELMLSLDYAARPDALPQDHPEIFQQVIESSLQHYGRVPLVTTRLVDDTPMLTLQQPMPEDTEAPRWSNTTVGFSELAAVKPPPYMVAGNEDRTAKPARVGLQKAIPGDGRVTLRWDVALDQTLPVRYNVFYSDVWPFDPAQAKVLAAVKTEVGGDYVDRSLSSADDGCPYETTVTGLQNGKTYFFLLRAEDSTSGMPGAAGRGPGGGRQDDNLNVLAAVPGARGAGPPAAIAIDGVFEDWVEVASYPDRTGEAANMAVDFTDARFAADDSFHYIFYQTAQPLDPAAGQQIFVNADGHSWTGLRTRGGADFVVRGGQLLRYQGGGLDESWTAVGPVEAARRGLQIELRLPRALLNASGEGPVFSFLGIRSTVAADTMPDQGAGFFLTEVPPGP
jgi:hypothetical protein